jgi:WhiB family redox-sensing transcriptional regulator
MPLAEPGPDWAEAACRGHDPNLWFPLRGESTLPAKAICTPCAIREQCLAYALGHPELVGVFGGTSQAERSRMRRGVAIRSPVGHRHTMTTIELPTDLTPGPNGSESGGLTPPGLEGSAPIPKAPEARECLLPGCHEPVTATGAKYCTPLHQRRASRQRVPRAPGTPLLPQEDRLSRDGLLITDPAPAGVWTALATVAASLPTGWRMELRPESASIIWATPPGAGLMAIPPPRAEA